MPHKAKDTRQIRQISKTCAIKKRTTPGSKKICRKGKATHLKSKRKASILNFGQPRKTEGQDL